jgi:hypothetical protein
VNLQTMRYLLSAVAGAVAGIVCSFALSVLTRLLGLMAPMDNAGVVFIEFGQALMWGVVCSISSAILLPWHNRLRGYILGTILSLVVIGLILVALGMNSRNANVRPELLSALLPLLVLGPLTAIAILRVEASIWKMPQFAKYEKRLM